MSSDGSRLLYTSARSPGIAADLSSRFQIDDKAVRDSRRSSGR